LTHVAGTASAIIRRQHGLPFPILTLQVGAALCGDFHLLILNAPFAREILDLFCNHVLLSASAIVNRGASAHDVDVATTVAKIRK
jgi:hypothetical protein